MFLIFLLTLVSSQCTFTQNRWIRVSRGLALDETMCGIAWHELMEVDPSRLIIPENSLWVVGFHQYVSAVLNRRQVEVNDSLLDDAILLIGDSLERACHNVSQWKLLPTLTQSLNMLYNFNHGILESLNTSIACRDEYNNSVGNETFYYYQTPDIIAVRDPVTNMTSLRSVFSGLYQTQIVLYVALGLSGLMIGFVLLKLVMTRSEKRRYFWRKRDKGKLDELEMTSLETFNISSDSEESKESNNKQEI